MRRTPLIPVALALMTGIATQHWLTTAPTLLWWALTLTAAVAVGILLTASRRMSVIPSMILVLLCTTGIGGSLGRRFDPQSNELHWIHRTSADKAFLMVKLTETPQPRKRSWRSKARVVSVDGKPVEGDITLYFKKDSMASRLKYGDQLLIHDHPDIEKKTLYTTSDHYIITAQDTKTLRAHSERLRMQFLHGIQQGPLEKREAGIAAAMTLGWKADMEPETQTAFRDAGLAHLLAVSGLHVGLVASIMSLLFFWIPRTRHGRMVRGAISLISVWGFTLLTGLAPSTIRAALMFSLFIVSDIGERDTPKMNLLALTAILTLTARPMLLFDIGWQLSYAAVAGILLAHPLIILSPNRLWQAAMVSLAATVSTLPITTTVFHTIQPYFLIANVLIVPLAGVILALALCHIALPVAATAWPLEMMLKGTEWLTTKVAKLPGAVIELAPTSGTVTLVVAALVAAVMIGGNLTMRWISRPTGL